MNKVKLDWYHRHREQSLKLCKKYYENHREAKRLYEKSRYEADGKRKRETSRLRYHANRKVRVAQIKKYKAEHPEVSYRASLKIIKKMAVANNLTDTAYMYANIAWKGLIRRNDEDRCVVCGASGQDTVLHAHHLIFKSIEPALALTESNGVMICIPHHQELHKLNPIKHRV